MYMIVNTIIQRVVIVMIVALWIIVDWMVVPITLMTKIIFIIIQNIQDILTGEIC